MLCAPTPGEATVAGRIVVVRDPAVSGWAARFAVRIDDRRVGKVRNGAGRDFEVEPGVHRVRVSQTGFPSRTLVISVADGETVVLRSRVRFWANFLAGMSGCLIGSSCAWLLLAGPTPVRVVNVALGVAGLVAFSASKSLISLRPDPAAGYGN
jgi:hypothetical protein